MVIGGEGVAASCVCVGSLSMSSLGMKLCIGPSFRMFSLNNINISIPNKYQISIEMEKRSRNRETDRDR